MATPRVPALNGSSSNTPIGPFQRIVLASAMMRAYSSTVFGPMSRPIMPRGISAAGTVRRSAVAEISAAATTSCGTSTSTPRSRARALAARTSSNRSRSQRLVPISPPSAAISVNAIAPPISSTSTRSINDSITASLSLTLRPAEDRHVGPLRIVEQARQHLDLALHQPARDRRAAAGEHELGQRGDARVRTVRGTERVVDVRVGELGEPSGEGRVVRFLARIEPQVLEQHDGVVGQLRRSRLGERGHGFPDQLRQPRAHRCQPEVLVHLALGAAEVRGEHDRGPAFAELADRGERRDDACVVGHRPGVERHVEVGTHEDARAGDVAEVVERAQAHGDYRAAARQSFAATRAARSTRRLE